MSKKILRSLLATSALTFGLPTMALAQDAQTDGADAAASGDIIVTARRGEENLQDVPVSLQVVSGDRLQDLAITSADELSKLAPGLTLVNAGASSAITLRGVTWQPGSGTPATPIYFNEVPFDPGQVVQSLFDIGQIEVLRGPQGTTRGAPSISGALTITTHKPDLNDFGGYVQGLYGSGDHWDVQGAINIPIIQDRLAIRFAANIEESDGLRIYSVNSDVQPIFKDRSYRVTVLAKPTDNVTLQAMYQRRETKRRNYTQVEGTGSPGFAFFGIPANFNGPALTRQDRASVQDLPSTTDETLDLLTATASWEIFGQKLSYTFGRQFNRDNPSFTTSDPLNILPGFEPFTSPRNAGGVPRFRTHEVRLSSMPDPDRPFDYDIGWFSKKSGGGGRFIEFSSPVYLPGAFGTPFQTIPGQFVQPNPRYVLNTLTDIRLGQDLNSYYGNLRFKLSENTELTGGVSVITDRQTTQLQTSLGDAFQALNNPTGGAFTCPQIGLIDSPNYAGLCEAAIPSGLLPGSAFDNSYTAAIYNFSLSHKFTPDLLVYATTGSSFRTGLPAINNNGLPDGLQVPDPEKAKSYELGVKASLGRKVRVNAAIFQLDYDGQLTTFEGVSYFNSNPPGQLAQTSLAFYRNVDSRVRGFELEVFANPIENLSLGANLSYSKIKSQGGLVPCNDAARPITAANPINLCESVKGDVLNQTPPFQATVNGSYEVPFTDAIGAYVRFNVNYRGRNPNFGNFRTGDGFKSTPSFTIVDLFAGLTGNDSGWELGVYGKNVFNKQVELSRIARANTIFPLFAAPSGYDVVRSSTPREYGVSVRFAFGSR